MRAKIQIGHFGRYRHPRVMPLRLCALDLRLRRPTGSPVGSHQIKFPTRLQARLDAACQRQTRLGHGARASNGRIDIGQQYRTGSGLQGTSRFNARERLRHRGRRCLCSFDQLHQFRIALLLPPTGEGAHCALVWQRCLPLRRSLGINLRFGQGDGAG